MVNFGFGIVSIRDAQRTSYAGKAILVGHVLRSDPVQLGAYSKIPVLGFGSEKGSLQEGELSVR